MDNELRFAVLIDADNISDKYIRIVLEETANYGVATYKRIYGDWTMPQMSSWKAVLLDNSVNPIQQYRYTTGKNATDSAMIIDAMDILYSGTVDGFCLVSSDSDFTRLATRLREAGMKVIGMGESKTPQPFISACNHFKYLDLIYERQLSEEAELHGGRLHGEEEAAQKNTAAQEAPSRPGWDGDTWRKSAFTKYQKQRSLRRVVRMINEIIDQLSDEDDWIFLGKLGDQLSKRLPDFDVRNFGFSKFTPFIQSLGEYELRELLYDNGRQKQIYVRKALKEDKK